MSDNEKLIEEAAKALCAAENAGEASWYRSQARVAGHKCTTCGTRSGDLTIGSDDILGGTQ